MLEIKAELKRNDCQRKKEWLQKEIFKKENMDLRKRG